MAGKVDIFREHGFKAVDEQWLDRTAESMPGGGIAGCIPLPEGKRFSGIGPAFEEVYGDKIIPRDDWKEIIDRQVESGAYGYKDDLMGHWQNQYPEHTCTCNAATQGHQYKQSHSFGGITIALSAMSVYKQFKRSRWGGAMCGQAIRQLNKTGALPLDTPLDRKLFKHVWPQTGREAFGRQFPDGWEETAKMFRTDEFYEVRTMEGFVTALLLDFPINYGRAGHSIEAFYVTYTESRGKIRFIIKSKCSYGPNGGDGDGFVYDSVDWLRRVGAGYDAYAARSIHVPDLFFDQKWRKKYFSLANAA